MDSDTVEILSEYRGAKRARASTGSSRVDEDEVDLTSQRQADTHSEGALLRRSKRRRGGATGSEDSTMRLDDKEQSSNTPQKGGVSTFANGPSTNGVSTNGESNGHTSNKLVAIRPSGNFFGHDREEVTRILIQSLTDLGYHGAATQLSRESGYELENTSVAAFRHAIQEGDWAEAEALLFGPRSEGMTSELTTPSGKPTDQWMNAEGESTYKPRSGLPLAEGANKREMLFLIRQQKYLELLEDRDLGSALTVLRQEITPLHQDTSRLHSLSRSVAAMNIVTCC